MQVVAGIPEFRVIVEEAVPDLSEAGVYRVVNAMITRCDSWVITLPDGTKATVPSSVNYYATEGRHSDARAKKSQGAANTPAPGKMPRGRPRKGA